MSGNELYDEIKRKMLMEGQPCVNTDLFSSIKHLDKRFLENIYCIIICFYIEQYSIQQFPLESIIPTLTTSLPYNGRLLNPASRKGLSFRVADMPAELLVIISFYLKNYFTG